VSSPMTTSLALRRLSTRPSAATTTLPTAVPPAPCRLYPPGNVDLTSD
jgi:hypothetical protein